MSKLKKSIFYFILSNSFIWSYCVFAASSTQGNIKIAIDAEFGLPNSTSAQAIRNGAKIAVNEINSDGGVLGRKLELIERDNRSVPARSLNNLRELAADSDVVAIMCGRYSPAVIEILPEINLLKIPYLDPWAAADEITENNFSPNYVFRLSLKDTFALKIMMRHALNIGAKKVGFLSSNSSWGRSSLKAAERTADQETHQDIVSTQWYNWGDESLLDQYQVIRKAGAQAVIFIANDREADILVREVANLPKEQRLPIVAHWGVTGGGFFEKAKTYLSAVDFSVVQTYTFIGKSSPIAKHVLSELKAITGSDNPREVSSPVGVANAYDLVHLLAMAIKLANSSDRDAIRNALEKLGPYQGLVRNLDKPFTAKRHDALTVKDVFMARYGSDGAIEPMGL